MDPVRKLATYADIAAAPDDQAFEVLDGELTALSAPRPRHTNVPPEKDRTRPSGGTVKSSSALFLSLSLAAQGCSGSPRSASDPQRPESPISAGFPSASDSRGAVEIPHQGPPRLGESPGAQARVSVHATEVRKRAADGSTLEGDTIEAGPYEAVLQKIASELGRCTQGLTEPSIIAAVHSSGTVSAIEPMGESPPCFASLIQRAAFPKWNYDVSLLIVIAPSKP